jgi:hypothetical protein
MDNGQKRRWAFLGMALLATVAAIAYPVEEPVDAGPVHSTPANPRVEAANVIVARSAAAPEWLAMEEDPFAVKGWTPPPPPAPPAPVSVARAVEPVNISAPPPPPPLPFQFIGQMDTGSEQLVYLGRGDQIQLAKIGESIDGTYKLLSVSKTHLEFEIVATGERQSLPIPATEK